MVRVPEGRRVIEIKDEAGVFAYVEAYVDELDAVKRARNSVRMGSEHLDRDDLLVVAVGQNPNTPKDGDGIGCINRKNVSEAFVG